MKFAYLPIRVVLILLFTVNCCFAEIQYSEKLIKDVVYTYGYFTGQEAALTAIEEKYPSLKSQVFIARNTFSAAFCSSLKNIESKMQEKIGKKEWKDVKESIYTNIKQTVEFSYTEEESLLFLEEVKQRASGYMSSPVCETLLLFNPRYMDQPENEFLDGFVATYSSAGNPKAKGLDFTISYPMSWSAKEGNRPNIVQKFGSVHREGHPELMVIVKNVPEFNELNLSQEDWVQMVDETASSGDFSSFLPAGATLIAGEKVVLETLPGFFLRCNNTVQRGRHSINFQSVMYMLFYKDKGIIISVGSDYNIDNKNVHHGSLEKNAKLLELMVNSFVLNNLWQD